MEDGRQLRRRRVTLLVVCVPVSLFFALMVFGIATTIGDPSAWAPGDAEIVVAVTVLCGIVAAVTGLSAAWLSSRIAESEDVSGYLPEANRPSGEASRDRVAAAGWTRAMRRPARRAALIGFACALAIAGSAVWSQVSNQSAEHLLHYGTRVPGQVTAVRKARRESGFLLDICYLSGGVVKNIVIRPESDLSYVAGQAVTVIYDPADPTRIRTVEERNIGEGTWTGIYLLFLAGLAGTAGSAPVVAGWVRRQRRARITGWRETTVVQAPWVVRSRLLLVVTFADQSRIVLRPMASSSYAAGQATGGRPVEARVSGTGGAMTVLVPRAGRRPWLIAVKAMDRRG